MRASVIALLFPLLVIGCAAKYTYVSTNSDDPKLHLSREDSTFRGNISLYRLNVFSSDEVADCKKSIRVGAWETEVAVPAGKQVGVTMIMSQVSRTCSPPGVIFKPELGKSYFIDGLFIAGPERGHLGFCTIRVREKAQENEELSVKTTPMKCVN